MSDKLCEIDKGHPDTVKVRYGGAFYALPYSLPENYQVTLSVRSLTMILPVASFTFVRIV